MLLNIEIMTNLVGKRQKATIILTIAECPWFSDKIESHIGVTDDIWERRLGEFKNIPIQVFDQLARSCVEHNQVQIDKGELQKN